jgi:two-component system, NtrC family, sensor histidine kinase GlrK
LQMLIEDLLDYHRAQEVLARLELRAVRVDRIIEQVLDQHRLAAQARSVRTDLRMEPVVLTADAEKLRVVVDNLVSNALKYSPDGGTISLALARRGDKVVLEVSDRGPGIPSRDHARIFEWFYRSAREHHGRLRGSGLGLAIAREFVAAHQGRIEVVDDGAAGARFRVTLPGAGRMYA